MTEKRIEKAAKLRALQHTFGAQLPERLAAIRQAWATSKLHPEDNESSQEFYRLVHSLAGSSGTFGYFRLGEWARQLEEFLLQITATTRIYDVNAQSIDSALTRMELLAAKGIDSMAEETLAAALPQNTSATHEQPLVYLLEDDALLATEIMSQLELFGYAAKAHTNASAILQSQQSHPADIFLLDIALPQGALEGPRVATELQHLSVQLVPAVFISAHDHWEARLAVVRAGGNAYFTKPLDFTALIERLDQLTGRRVDDAYRVLIVDDSALLAEHYSTVLQGAGMETAVVKDPAQLLEVLSAFSPDLVLMDLHMPTCSGVDAAQVIRQISTYSGLPIVYLSTESALQQQLNALKLGGDDFLKKPIADTHLITAVSIRVERFRGLKKLMTCDSLTGLLNNINIKLTLERELAQARRREGFVTFAMIDIDHFKAINDQYGHPMGDRVIKSLARLITQRLRKTDIAGRYGGEEFAIILPDTDADTALSVIENLRKGFSEIVFHHDSGDYQLTFSAGIASAPPRRSMSEFIQAADLAMYAAKHSGRNRVVQHSSLGP